MDYNTILVIVATVLFGANVYFINKDNKKALEETVREQALQLFLYAEKQDWIGEVKMDYVCEQIYKLVDDSVIAKVIKKSTIREWLQNLYDEVKDNLQKVIQ
jgi:Na+/phosphate symporter